MPTALAVDKLLQGKPGEQGFSSLWTESPPGLEWGLSPMPKGRDEVEAAVHSVVLDVLPVQATLITEILLKLLVNVISDGLPAGKGIQSKQNHQ